MRLTARVWLVGSGRTGFGLTDDRDCNVYLIDGGSEQALVDSGMGMATQRIVDQIVHSGFAPSRVRHLLLTHGHVDHSGGAAQLQRQLGLSIVASPRVGQALSSGDEECIGLSAVRRVDPSVANYRLQACPVDRFVGDGDRILIGDLDVQVLDTSGHCEGHLSYLLRADGQTFLFSGDTVFARGRILLLAMPDCSIQSLARSLYRLSALGIDALLPGHGSIVLSDASSHIQESTAYLDRLAIPPNLV